jgi:ZIP family zinc transporter
MAAAFGWGLVAASSLVLGAILALRFPIGLRAIGLIMGFGSGVLISAVAFDLVVKRRSTRSRVIGLSWSGSSRAVECSSAETR